MSRLSFLHDQGLRKHNFSATSFGKDVLFARRVYTGRVLNKKTHYHILLSQTLGYPSTVGTLPLIIFRTLEEILLSNSIQFYLFLSDKRCPPIFDYFH